MEILKRFLTEHNLAARARVCYQCGVCAGGCPVGKWHGDFNPRRFIEMIRRDEVEDIVKDKKIWLCVYCMTCLERCPQKIEVSEIVVQLKNAAARLGNIPENEIKKSRAVMNTGWVQKPGSRILRIRQQLGLPDMAPGIEPAALQNMADQLGWKEKMESTKKWKHAPPNGYENCAASVKRDKAGE